MKRDVESLKRYGRPLLCTEYMARPAGSRFDPILAYLKAEHIGAYNWGFVAGKSKPSIPGIPGKNHTLPNLLSGSTISSVPMALPTTPGKLITSAG